MESSERNNSTNSGQQIRYSEAAKEQREHNKRRISELTKWEYIGDWFLAELRFVHFCYDSTVHITINDCCIYCGEAIPDNIRIALEMIKE